MPARIAVVDRFILTVSKQIPGLSCPACSEVVGGVRRNKSAYFRIIVPALEVVESRLSVVVVIFVPVRVCLTDGHGKRA